MKKVLVGGCFNSIHPGHIYFLKEAKKLGDELIVVLTNDKNNKKPYAIPARKRKKKLADLKIADKIVVGDSRDQTKIVKKIKPDIIALGYDQNPPSGLNNFRLVRINKLKNYSTKLPMTYRIRRLSLKDVPIVFQLSSKIILEDFPEYSRKVRQIYGFYIYNKKYFREFLKKKSYAAFGAFQGNKLVGFVCFKGDFGGVVYVDFLFIKKGYRGQGIGTALLKKGEDWALKNKYHYVWLFTESNRNIKYYTKRGFRYIGTHQRGWFGETDHIMAKRLHPQPFKEIFAKYFRKKKIKK